MRIKTEAEALYALKESKIVSLSKIPKKMRTSAVCLEAIGIDEASFEYVPEKFKTADLCLKAVKCPKRSGYEILEQVPKELKTLELCIEATSPRIYSKKLSPSI